MAFINADRIKETTTTTGTGPLTLAGAVVGFRSFLLAPMATNDTCSYAIVSATGLESEAGIGTFTSPNILTRTTVQSSSNGNAAVNFSAGVKDVFIGPIAGTQVPYDPVTGTLGLGVNALNDVAITAPTVNQVLKYSGTEWTNQADAVNVGTVTSVSGAGTVSGLTLTGTVTASGSLTLGGTLSAIPLATGVSGTLPVANGGTGVTTSTGTTNVVLSNSPTLVTPLSNTLSAIPVASGAGNSLTIAAGAGVGTGAGGSLILQAGIQATSGGDGKVIVKQVAGQTSNLHEWQNSAATVLGAFDSSGRLVVGKGIINTGIRFQSHEESTQNINYFTTGGEQNANLTFATNINGASRMAIIGFDYGNNVLKLIYGGAFGGQIAGLNINSSNNVGLGTVGPLAKLHAVAGAAATKGLIVQGAASQTANLQEWQNSAGTVLASVSAAGVVKTIVLTVATLPAAATAGAGARAFVSDATLTTFATVPIGGGANGVPVYSDGTNWYIG